MNDRTEAVRAALTRARIQFEDTASHAGVACDGCRHYRKFIPDPGYHTIGKKDQCVNPVYQTARNNLATGEVDLNGHESISEARSGRGLCGHDAILFDPPERALSWLGRLLFGNNEKEQGTNA